MVHKFRPLELCAPRVRPQTLKSLGSCTLPAKVSASHTIVWSKSNTQAWGHLLSHWVVLLFSRQVLSLSVFLG